MTPGVIIICGQQRVNSHLIVAFMPQLVMRVNTRRPAAEMGGCAARVGVTCHPDTNICRLWRLMFERHGRPYRRRGLKLVLD
jgi:hypothetical protein